MVSGQGGKGWKHSAYQVSVTRYHCSSHCFRSSWALPFCKYAPQNYRCYPELALHLNGSITILCVFCTMCLHAPYISFRKNMLSLLSYQIQSQTDWISFFGAISWSFIFHCKFMHLFPLSLMETCPH